MTAIVRRSAAAACLALAVAATGCTAFRDRLNNGFGQRPGVSGNIDVARIAEQVNANSRAIRSLQCNEVTVSGRARNPNGGTDPFTVDALLAFQAPHSFRLKGILLGRPEIDLGTNGDEFWFWAKRAAPDKVLVCDRREVGNVDLAIPFHPDTLAEILGVIEIDPAKWKPGNEKHGAYFIWSPHVTPDGRFARKLLVFQRGATPKAPDRLIRISLHDAGNLKQVLADANIEEWYDDPRTGISVPRAVRLSWPEQETNLHLLFKRNAIQVNTITSDHAAGLFSRASISEGREVIDLARTGRRAANFRPAGDAVRPAAAAADDEPPALDARRGPRRLGGNR